MNIPLKKPFNRKLLYVLLFTIIAFGVVAVLMVSFDDPRERIKQQQRDAELTAIEQQPQGDAERALRLLENENARLQRELEDNQKAREAAQQQRNNFEQMFAPPSGQAYDPDLLRLLDEAQQEAGRSPEVGRQVASTVSGRGGSRGGGEGGGLIYDNYRQRSPLASSDEGGDLFDDSNDRPDPGVYETLRPRAAPAERILSQGSSIHAVLMSNIDTRNDGDIIAMVTRDVYDSKTMRQRLIPQGSRLVGDYSTSVTPGADRIEVNFNRLIMPDGSAFDLPALRAGGGDGTSGVTGRYRSNLLQAIGPSFVVAFLGQVIDRQTKKDIPVNDAGVSVGPGGGLQRSPSILEQITPEINREILQRYQGARPYFLIKPGQHLRIQTTEDMEVPVPPSLSSASVSGGIH